MVKDNELKEAIGAALLYAEKKGDMPIYAAKILAEYAMTPTDDAKLRECPFPDERDTAYMNIKIWLERALTYEANKNDDSGMLISKALHHLPIIKPERATPQKPAVAGEVEEGKYDKTKPAPKEWHDKAIADFKAACTVISPSYTEAVGIGVNSAWHTHNETLIVSKRFLGEVMTDKPTIGHIGFGPLPRKLYEMAFAYEKALLDIKGACDANLDHYLCDHVQALKFIRSIATLAINTAGNSEYKEEY